MKKIGSVNTSVWLDPDWGATEITADRALRVTVSPGGAPDSGWWFFLLLPTTDGDHETLVLIQQVVESVLEDGDDYSVSEIGEEDVADFEKDSSIILSFNPHDDSEFIWISPPRSLKH